MNNFTEKIKKVLQILKNFFNINPHKHWNFLLYVFLSLVSILILFSFYLLFKIKNEQIFQVTAIQQENPILLKESALKATTELYNNKTKNVNEINNKPSVYGDPSL